VRDDDPGQLQLLEALHHGSLGGVIERTGRLVKKEERWPGDDSPGDKDPLLLAAGKTSLINAFWQRFSGQMA